MFQSLDNPPVEWSNFLDSDLLSDILKKHHSKDEITTSINESCPEGFLIRGLQLVEEDDRYHTDRFYSRHMYCVFMNSHHDKYNISCRIDLIKKLFKDNYFDCIVHLNTTDNEGDFELESICLASTWVNVDDLHMKPL